MDKEKRYKEKKRIGFEKKTQEVLSVSTVKVPFLQNQVLREKLK